MMERKQNHRDFLNFASVFIQGNNLQTGKDRTDITKTELKPKMNEETVKMCSCDDKLVNIICEKSEN